MTLTTDRNDPRLKKTVDDPEDIVPQNETYLVLSEEERAKGYVRNVRVTYTHVGKRPRHPIRPLTKEEIVMFDAGSEGWVAYEEYPLEEGPLGRFWTAAELESGCGANTTMGAAIAETYARDPKFYGSTYCCSCRRHIPVEEFVWAGTNERVGS